MTRAGQAAWAAFGALLRGHRRSRQLTQEALAARAGLSAPGVSLLERGRVEPRFATVASLADALGLTLSERRALEAAAEGVDDGQRGLGAVEVPIPRGGLSRKASSFVGRDRDLEAVCRRLGEYRLVTLTGPGGVGKTRLAVEAAHQLSEADSYPDGVWIAELAALADPALVPQAVAEAVGVALDPDAGPVSALADALATLRLLLVLDNCEHLVAACAEVAEALVGRCPGVRLLATSREPLGGDGEAVVRVPSLSVPAGGGAPSAAALLETGAGRLFVDRAGAGAPGFALTERNAPAVAEICRRLDGIPLALEFAARRVRALPVEEVAQRLDDRFRLLTGGNRTALPRHQTLRAAVAWSYEFLSPAEQALFVRLSVFAGAFTLEAAEAVCGGPDQDEAGGEPTPPADVLTGLLRLVDTSFVLPVGPAAAAGPTGAARYRLLETLREYGHERLVASGQAAALRDRHLTYYLDLLLAAGARAREAQPAALRRVREARDDLWAALAWVHDREDGAADRRLGEALARLAEQLTVPDVGRVLTPVLFETRRLGLSAYEVVGARLLAQTDPAVLAAAADLFWVIGDWAAEAALAQRREQVVAASDDARAVARAQLRGVRLLVF